MTTNSAGKWLGYGVGDSDDTTLPRTAPNWEAVTLINQKLHDKYQWARDLGVIGDSPLFTPATAAAIAELDQRVGIVPTLDESGNAVATLAVRSRLGSYPPPPPPTHAMLTCRGTGGIIGQDFTSQLAQALPGVYHEVPMDYAASMGGIPVGASTSGPSGDDAAIQLCALLTDFVMTTTCTLTVAGYSLGNKGLVMFLNNLFDPTNPLYVHRDRLVCVVLIADPWRPYGGSFFDGPALDGQGIGTPYFTLSAAARSALGWRICWLADPEDLYTNSPRGAVGQVLADVEEIVLETALSDPLGTIQKAIPHLLQLLQTDGGLQTIMSGQASDPLQLIPGVGPTLAQVVDNILAGILPAIPILNILVGLFESALTGIISGATTNGTVLPVGVAADVQAAILALKFYGGGIQPHLGYGYKTWNGQQTYLQLGIQHAADWGGRVPVSV